MADPQPPADEDLATIRNSRFETIACNLCPTLKRWTRKPQAIVKFEADSTKHFGVRPVLAQNALEQLPSLTWGKGDDFVLDFGIHMVGFLSFRLDSVAAHMDAPCRLRLNFSESPLDVTLGMDNVKTWISTSWLPDEIINIDECPTTLRLPRRYSFRYLKVEVIDTSPKFKVCLSQVECECVSAIGQSTTIEDVRIEDPLLQDIDHVSINTLRDCMQTVFEDGPRRDRRLWLGDLRLQALTNYCTFRDFNLVKRCLYMFAAFARQDGSIPACVFERPSLEPSTDYIVDYDALFAATLYDYVEASGDLATGHDLWPLVDGCLRRALAHLDPQTHIFDESSGKGWKFLDWAQGLEHSAGLHGVLLYCLRRADKLADLLGREARYGNTVTKMTAAASQFLSGDGDQILFLSGPNSQVSYASAAWLVLAEAFPQETARTALLNTLSHPRVVRPLTPYLWHHVCEALAAVGCYEQCLDIIREYWGGMVRAGADTFWESFDPKDAKASPYGDVRNNSFCHAWSCTPSYLLRGKLRSYIHADGGRETIMADLDEVWLRAMMKKLAG